MSKEDYRQRAEDAVLRAKSAPPDIARMLLGLAEMWLTLYNNARGKDDV